MREGAKKLWLRNEEWWKSRSELAWLGGGPAWALVLLYGVCAVMLAAAASAGLVDAPRWLSIRGWLHWLSCMVFFADCVSRSFRSDAPVARPLVTVAVQWLGFVLLASAVMGVDALLASQGHDPILRPMVAPPAWRVVLWHLCRIGGAPLAMLVLINLVRRGGWSPHRIWRSAVALALVALLSWLMLSATVEGLIWMGRMFTPFGSPVGGVPDIAFATGAISLAYQVVVAGVIFGANHPRSLISAEAAFIALLLPVHSIFLADLITPLQVTVYPMGSMAPNVFGLLLSISLALRAVSPGASRTAGDAARGPVVEGRAFPAGELLRALPPAFSRSPGPGLGLRFMALTAIGLGTFCLVGAWVWDVVGIWATTVVPFHALQIGGLLLVGGLAMHLHATQPGLREAVRASAGACVLALVVFAGSLAAFIGAEIIRDRPLSVAEAEGLCDAYFRSPMVVAERASSANGLLGRMHARGVCTDAHPQIVEQLRLGRTPVAEPLALPWYASPDGGGRVALSPEQAVIPRSVTRRGFWDEVPQRGEVQRSVLFFVSISGSVGALWLFVLAVFSRVGTGVSSFRRLRGLVVRKGPVHAFTLLVLCAAPIVGLPIPWVTPLLWLLVLLPWLRERQWRACATIALMGLASGLLLWVRPTIGEATYVTPSGGYSVVVASVAMLAALLVAVACVVVGATPAAERDEGESGLAT